MELIQSNSILPERLKMFVAAPVRKERLALCNACDHAVPIPLLTHRRCDLCNCVVELKTTIKAASCPINKWTESTADYQQ